LYGQHTRRFSFETGVLLYRGKAVQSVKKDFLHTLPKSQEITLRECTHNAFYLVVADVLRIFAPLM
jgi:cardiolipin synthase